VLDLGDQPVPVARHAATEEGLRAAGRGVHDGIARLRRAQPVEPELGEPGAVGDRDLVADRGNPHVVEPAAVRRPRRRRVLGACQLVAEIGAGRDVEHPQHRLVGVVLLDRVSDVAAVPARRPAAQARRAVGAPLVGIEQHLLGAGFALFPVDDHLLHVGSLPHVEVPAAAVDRRADRVEVKQLLESRRELIAMTRALERGAGEPVLLGHPRLDLGGVLVLEPAVGIDDAAAVQDLADIVALRRRPRVVGRHRSVTMYTARRLTSSAATGCRTAAARCASGPRA